MTQLRVLTKLTDGEVFEQFIHEKFALSAS